MIMEINENSNFWYIKKIGITDAQPNQLTYISSLFFSKYKKFLHDRLTIQSITDNFVDISDKIFTFSNKDFSQFLCANFDWLTCGIYTHIPEIKKAEKRMVYNP